MPENAAESVVEEQRKVPETKNCLFPPFFVFLCNNRYCIIAKFNNCLIKPNRRRPTAKQNNKNTYGEYHKKCQTKHYVRRIPKKAFLFIFGYSAKRKRCLKKNNSLAIFTAPDPQGSGRVDIFTHPYTTAARAAGVVTRTAGRDSSRYRFRGNGRTRQLALDCECN